MHPNVPPFLEWCERDPEGRRALRREDAAELADRAIAQHELEHPAVAEPPKASTAPSAMLDNLPALDSQQPPYHPFTLYGAAANGAWIPARPPEIQSGPATMQAAYDIMVGPFPLWAEDPYGVDADLPDALTGLTSRYAVPEGVAPLANLYTLLEPLGFSPPSSTTYGENFAQDTILATFHLGTGPNFTRDVTEYVYTGGRFKDNAILAGWREIRERALGPDSPKIPDPLSRALRGVAGQGPFDPTSPIHRIDLAIAREVIAEEAKRAEDDERFAGEYSYGPKDLKEVDAFLAHYPPVGSFLNGEHGVAVFGPLEDWPGDPAAKTRRSLRRYLRWFIPRFLKTHSRRSTYWPADGGGSTRGINAGDFLLLHWKEFVEAPVPVYERAQLLTQVGMQPFGERQMYEWGGPISDQRVLDWLHSRVMGSTYGSPQWAFEGNEVVYRRHERVPEDEVFRYPLPRVKGRRDQLKALVSDPGLVRAAALHEAVQSYGTSTRIYVEVKRRWDAVRKQFP